MANIEKKNVLYTYTEDDFPEGEAPYYVVIDLSDISKFTDAMNNIGEPLAYERDEDKAYYLFNTEDEVYIFTSAIEGKYEYEIYGPDESEEFNADIEDPEDYYDEATEIIKRNNVPTTAFARLKNTGFSVSEFNKIRETFIEEKRKRRQLELHNNPEAILKNEQFKDLPCVNVLLYGTKDAGKKTMVSALSKALASMGTATIKEVSDLEYELEYNKLKTGFATYGIEGNVKGKFNFKLTALEDEYELNRYLMVHKNCFDVGMLVYNPFYMNVGFNDALHNIVENTGLVTRTMVVMTMQDKMQEEQSIIKRAMQDEAFAQLIEFDGKDYVAQWYENLKHYAVRYTTYKAEDWITNPEWTKTSEYYIDPIKVSPNKVDADNVSINKAICSKAIQTLGKYAKKESERPFRLFVDKVFQDPKSDRKLLLCDLVCGEIKSDMEKIGGFGHNGGHIAKIYGVCGEGYYLYPVETTYTSGDYIGLIVEDERKNEFDHGDIFQPKIDLHDENSMLTWIYIEKDPYKTGQKFELHEKEDAIWIRYYDHLYLMAIGSYSLKEGVNKKVYLDFLKNRGCFPVIYGEAFEVVEDDRTIGYGYIRNQWRV